MTERYVYTSSEWCLFELLQDTLDRYTRWPIPNKLIDTSAVNSLPRSRAH